MSKMYKVLPHEFDFVPKTWLMPAEYTSLAAHAIEMKKSHQKRTFIMKPANGAMGHGIKLFKNIDKIIPTDNFIVQEYIANPYLLDDYKFDLRIYALVTSCDPLRAFIFNNGLVRLGTEKYQEPTESNIDHLYMHLTNYSVNKRSKNYDEGDSNGETGTKRSLKYLFDYFSRKNIDSSKVWKSIQDIILKTLLVAEPYLFQ
jgi:tubulin polyglutamylase TTLL7